MIIGRVTGNIHATLQHPFYAGQKLLTVQKIQPDGSDASGYLVAVDTVGAGVGETVLIVDEGNGARQIVQSKEAPVRSVIVGIIDQLNEGKNP